MSVNRRFHPINWMVHLIESNKLDSVFQALQKSLRRMYKVRTGKVLKVGQHEIRGCKLEQ